MIRAHLWHAETQIHEEEVEILDQMSSVLGHVAPAQVENGKDEEVAERGRCVGAVHCNQNTHTLHLQPQN